MDAIMGRDMVTSSLLTGIVPILFSCCIYSSFRVVKTAANCALIISICRETMRIGAGMPMSAGISCAKRKKIMKFIVKFDFIVYNEYIKKWKERTIDGTT